ncbi:MAG: hypothetical protein Q8R82_20970 [Hyphomonadaceae bacterium]|nr:hypothetical protein [Hyphomonadaceae bacterium]
MSFYQIILRLARNPGYPDGDDSQGYVIVAPLDLDDHLDPVDWATNRELCTVIRFKPGTERDADGRLTHHGSHWSFHYDAVEEGDDESVFRLGDHRLTVGDYVTVHEGDGQFLTYRVAERTEVHSPNAIPARERA